MRAIAGGCDRPFALARAYWTAASATLDRGPMVSASLKAKRWTRVRAASQPDSFASSNEGARMLVHRYRKPVK